MAKVVANPDPVPDPAKAKRPSGPVKAKTVTKVAGSLPGNPPPPGQGRISNRPRYSGKGR
jgi:hypothetical protein